MTFSVGENLRNRHILLIGMLNLTQKLQFGGFILQKQEHMRAYDEI